MTPLIYAGLARPIRLAFNNRNHLPIIFVVCNVMGINQEELVSSSRKRKLSIARCIISYFLRKNTSLTLLEIGRMLGGRDHSTILYQVQMYKDLYDTDKSFRSLADKIRSRIAKL